MDIGTGISLLVGALLAITGGQIQAHFQFRRRLRVSARALFEDLCSEMGSCYTERQRIAQTRKDRPPEDLDERLEVDDAVWLEHQSIVAELRETRSFEQIRHAYDTIGSFGRLPTRHQVEWEMRIGILNPNYGIGEGSDRVTYYEVREDSLDSTITTVSDAARRVGRWAKIGRREIESRIQMTKPHDDPDAPGYSFEAYPLKKVPLDDAGNPIGEAEDIYVVRSITKRPSPTEPQGGTEREE